MKVSITLRKTATVVFVLLVGLYLIAPARVCGLNCPTCLTSAENNPEETQSAVPACHQEQAPSCHQVQTAEKECSSNSDQPHQCCMKSMPSLTSQQKFIPASQELKTSKLEVATTFNSAEKFLEQSPTLKPALDSHHHKFKASSPLYLLNLSLLI